MKYTGAVGWTFIVTSIVAVVPSAVVNGREPEARFMWMPGSTFHSVSF